MFETHKTMCVRFVAKRNDFLAFKNERLILVGTLIFRLAYDNPFLHPPVHNKEWHFILQASPISGDGDGLVRNIFCSGSTKQLQHI